MENISKLIESRKSVRTYDGTQLPSELLEKLCQYMANIPNPYGIPVEFRLMYREEKGLSSPVLAGEKLYVGGIVAPVPHGEEAYGYSFEKLVLYAWSLGLGTVWIGGTMDRTAFEKAIGLEQGKRMPCMTPVGRPAEKMSLRESMMRKAIKADSRKPFAQLFFDGSFEKPLTEQAAGRLALPLEMVRWAPSAVNKQPWRVVRMGDMVHFYLNKGRGFESQAVGDMQKIDLGIALCHFELAAQEQGLNPHFVLQDPQFSKGEELVYIASYQVEI